MQMHNNSVNFSSVKTFGHCEKETTDADAERANCRLSKCRGRNGGGRKIITREVAARSGIQAALSVVKNKGKYKVRKVPERQGA